MNDYKGVGFVRTPRVLNKSVLTYICKPVWKLSHPDLRANPGVNQMCARMKSHTYDDSVYRDECHNFYYITIMSYKITDNKIDRTKITISTTP